MTRDEIIEMAREAGLAVKPPYWGYTEQYHFAGFEQTFEQFVACVEERAAATEREACAKLAAWILKMPENDVSSAIRASGNE